MAEIVLSYSVHTILLKFYFLTVIQIIFFLNSKHALNFKAKEKKKSKKMN